MKISDLYLHELEGDHETIFFSTHSTASDSNNHLKVQASPTSSTPHPPHPTHLTPSTQADTSPDQQAEDDSSDAAPSAKRPKMESQL